MALDLNHGIYVRRGGRNYFYSSYTHAVSPALAFRVGGVTRYCPLVSGGGYLRVRKSGTTYGISGGSATVEVTCTFNKLTRTWSKCAYNIGNNGFAVVATISVQVVASNLTQSHSLSVPANTSSDSVNVNKVVSILDRTVNVTISVFGKTYTGSASSLSSATSTKVTITVS